MTLTEYPQPSTISEGQMSANTTPRSDRKAVLLRMSAEDLERLDRACGMVPRTRFIRDAIERRIAALTESERERNGATA